MKLSIVETGARDGIKCQQLGSGLSVGQLLPILVGPVLRNQHTHQAAFSGIQLTMSSFHLEAGKNIQTGPWYTRYIPSHLPERPGLSCGSLSTPRRAEESPHQTLPEFLATEL